MKRPCSVSRRGFLQATAGFLTLVSTGMDKARASLKRLDPREAQGRVATTVDPDARVMHSVCLGCNARCGDRTVVKDGKLVKVSGNPYHPYNNQLDPLAYKTPAADTLGLSSPACGKAQDAPNYVYSPYRILKPLKRAGARGSGKFEPIEWEQLIREISEGGRLFAHLGEERLVPGLRQLDSDTPIDPAAPELGPARNGFVFIAGRDQAGRKQFINRFVKDAFGSINRVAHTDICGLGFRMGNYAFTEGKAAELKADSESAEFILVFGANIYEALQPGVNSYGAMIAKRHADGELDFTVVDPRATNASVHAKDWIAIKPGQDGAFAMGMIRWIIENRRYNEAYLAAPGPEAARALGHGCYSNATHLVITDEGHEDHGRFLRLAHLDPTASRESGAAYLVLTQDLRPVAFDSVDEATLDAEATVTDASGKGIQVKTAYRLMKEGVFEHSLAEYAALAGVERAQIENTARDFTAHGSRAAVTQYHGAGNYASGTYAAYAIAVLNAMIGSVNRKGGYMKTGGGAAPWRRGPYDLKGFAGRRRPSGVPISREKAHYEASSEYRRKKAAGGSGYPALRPWFSFTKGGLCVETLSGIEQRYPYSCQVLFTYFFNPVYSIPGGPRYVETLKSPERVPLHVSIDIAVNESNLYADYIVPDVTYPEGHYGFLSPHAPVYKFTGVRTPSIEALTGRTGDGRPFCLETFLIDVAKRLDLPGFGDAALRGDDGRSHALDNAEDYFLRGIANLAVNAKVPKAGAAEMRFVEDNYPVAASRHILKDGEWKRACYVLARGGVFQLHYADHFEGENHRFGLQRVALYNEQLAMARNSLTGERFPGTLKYLAPVDSQGNRIAELDEDYPFSLVTYKMNLHAQSRTVLDRWSMEVFPENYVMVHQEDAARLGLRDDDPVRLVSRSNPEGITGKLKATRLIRPGCIAISNHYGHTQLGASPLSVKNGEQVFLGGREVVSGDVLIANPKIAAGIHPNPLSRLDENLANTPLVDLVGGIPDFSSTRVRISKAVGG